MSGVGTAARETEQTGLFAGYPACPPLLGVARVDQGPNHGCTKFNAAVLADLRDRDDAPVVILAARWPIAAEGYLAPNELGGPALLAWADGPDRGPHLPEDNFEIFKRAISETVAAITSTGRQVIILGGVPEIGWNVPRRLGSQLLFGLRLPPPPTIEAVSRRQRRAESVLAALATAPDVAYLPLAQLFCDPQCRVSLEGRPLYYDDDHLSHYGSVEIIGQLFLEQVWHARNGSVY
jgi:hypothetical protein